MTIEHFNTFTNICAEHSWKIINVFRNNVDFGEFLALELMRLGRVDVGTLSLLKQEFTRLDSDRSGSLSKKEAMNPGRR